LKIHSFSHVIGVLIYYTVKYLVGVVFILSLVPSSLDLYIQLFGDLFSGGFLMGAGLRHAKVVYIGTGLFGEYPIPV